MQKEYLHDIVQDSELHFLNLKAYQEKEGLCPLKCWKVLNVKPPCRK